MYKHKWEIFVGDCKDDSSNTKTGITLALFSIRNEHKLGFQMTAKHVHEPTSQKPKNLCLF
jgi:hypothetical protein